MIPEDLAGAVHLLPADLGDVGEHLGPVHLRVEHRTTLAAGAGDHVHVDALSDVLGRRRGALAGLVVGVRVHVHEPETGLPGVRHVAHPRIEVVSDPTEIATESPAPGPGLPPRYGGRPRRRVLPVALGTLFALVLLAWAIWAGLASDNQAIDASVTSYRVVDSHQVQVRISAHFRDAKAGGTCLVRATAADHSVVGRAEPHRRRAARRAGHLDPAADRTASHHGRAGALQRLSCAAPRARLLGLILLRPAVEPSREGDGEPRQTVRHQ